MEIEYNTPIQVSKEIKDIVITRFKGICAHRTDSDGNHWIVLWYCRPEFKLMLNKLINGSN